MALDTATPKNPFVLVHDAMWSLIDSNPMWDSLVKLGNRIRFNSATDRSPIKSDKGTADYPELWLCPSAGKVNTHQTSCAVKVVQTYTWVLSTADWRSSQILEQCQFAMLCSMTEFQPTLLSVQWEGVSFIRRVDAQSYSIGGTDPKKHGGIVGWSAMWQNEIELELPRSALTALATRPSCS